MKLPIIEGKYVPLTKALNNLGIDYMEPEYHVQRINIRQFEHGAQGYNRIVAVFVGPVATITMPVLEKFGTGGCNSECLTRLTKRLMCLNGIVFEITKWKCSDDGAYILVPSDFVVISELDKLRAQREEILESLARINDKIAGGGGAKLS